ncbi:virginiamycin B lyase family protein [Spirillospora sp. CA-253888]
MGHRRRTRTGALVAAAVLAAVPAAVALQAPAGAAEAAEYPVPTSDSAPFGITAGPDGSIWWAEHAGGIGRREPSGKVTLRPFFSNSKNNHAVPTDMATATDGAIWFADANWGSPRLGRVDQNTGAFNGYEPQNTGDIDFSTGQLTGVTRGEGVTMWFAAGYSGAVGQIDASGRTTAYATGMAPYDLVQTADKTVWFTSQDGRIGKLDPATGQVTAFDPPDAASGTMPGEIIAGPDGKIWFTRPGLGRIGQIDPATGQFTDHPLPTADSKPAGLVAAPDGKIWFTEAAASNIGQLDPATGQITEHPLPARLSAPTRIAVAPDGKLWYTAPGRGRIGRIDPADPPSGAAHPAVPALSPGMPNGAAAFQNRCPVGGICQTQVTTAGKAKIGKFVQELPPGAIRITGSLLGSLELQPPLTGKQLEGAPIEVKGGLIGQLPLIGPILGLSPAAMWKVNRLTISQSLAGPIQVVFGPDGMGARTKLNMHLNNDLLGAGCVIGPIEVDMTPKFLSGSLGGEPTMGWLANQIGINAPIAVPKAKGCGPGGFLDGVINQMMGLPSPASQNTMELTGIVSLGGGINASNVPDARVAPGSAAAKAKALLNGAKRTQTAKPPAKVAKPVKVTVKVRRR